MTTNSLQQINKGLYFIPIGGSDQIGMNCNVYMLNHEDKEEILIVDLGLGFAEDIPGVCIAIPDLNFVFTKKNKEKIVGIVITHVHEDHCGALTYLLKYLPKIRIYASKFAIVFIKAKLQENNQRHESFEFIEIQDNGKDFEIGNFNVEFIQLTHSTVEMMALLIKTKLGTIFHTGDWKFDDAPVIGEPINIERLRKIGDSGVDLMVSDSTNITTKGRAGSEASVYDGIYKVCSEANSRVIFTMFASNVARMSTIFSVAKKLGKKVFLVGRAIWRVYNSAIETGYFEDVDPSMVLSETEIMSQKPEHTIILCTGCQAEETAALTKIVHGKHRHIKLLKHDLIVFSSKNIPGNERRIYNLQNKIIRFGARFLTNSEENKVHVSGHPTFEDVKDMYELIKPKIAIPVHGEDVHTARHAQLARDLGVEKVIVVHNGDVIKIEKQNISETSKIGEVRSGFLYVDGKLFRKMNDPVLKTRAKIMNDGLMLVSIFINKRDGTLNQIKLFAPGLLDQMNDSVILDRFSSKIEKEINNLIKTNDRKFEFYHTGLSLAKKLCRNELGKDPIIKIDTIYI